MATTEASATHVPVAEAKARFSEMLRRAAAGEEIVVTSHGRPIARILGPDSSVQQRRDDAVQALLDARQHASGRARGITHDEIVEWIHEGRRY